MPLSVGFPFLDFLAPILLAWLVDAQKSAGKGFSVEIKVGDKDKRKASNTSLLAMATLAETVYSTSSGLSEMPVWSFEWHNFAILPSCGSDGTGLKEIWDLHAVLSLPIVSWLNTASSLTSFLEL